MYSHVLQAKYGHCCHVADLQLVEQVMFKNTWHMKGIESMYVLSFGTKRSVIYPQHFNSIALQQQHKHLPPQSLLCPEF